MRAWEDNPILRRVLIALVAVVALAVVVKSTGAVAAPACDPSLPQPPLLVVLPDGTEIPAAGISYDVDGRRLAVTGYSGIFCNGFEATVVTTDGLPGALAFGAAVASTTSRGARS